MDTQCAQETYNVAGSSLTDMYSYS